MNNEKAPTIPDLEKILEPVFGMYPLLRAQYALAKGPDALAKLEEEPGRDFVMERSKLAAQREDAAEHRQELVRMDTDRLRDEAIELMVREPEGNL